MDTDIPQIDALVLQARSGSAEAVWDLLAACREYLLACVGERLRGRVRAKANPSDVVGDVILEARRDFPAFRGQSKEEWLGWLRRLLLNNLANFNRTFYHTQKRSLDREERLPVEHVVHATGSTPVELMFNSEEWSSFCAALDVLPPEAKRAFVLRYRDGLPFRVIGERMQEHPDRVRRLCQRTLTQLRRRLRIPVR